MENLRSFSHLVALNASSGKLVLVASGAIDLLLARDEALSPDRVLAYHAAEALLVPLPGLVLHLLRTWKDAKKTLFSLKLPKLSLQYRSTRVIPRVACNCTLLEGGGVEYFPKERDVLRLDDRVRRLASSRVALELILDG